MTSEQLAEKMKPVLEGDYILIKGMPKGFTDKNTDFQTMMKKHVFSDINTGLSYRNPLSREILDQFRGESAKE